MLFLLTFSLPEKEIEVSWNRYRASWNLRPQDRMPFKLINPGPQIVMEKVLVDPKPLLETQIFWIQQHYKLGIRDDFIPYLIPYPSEGVIVTAFGCEPFFRKGALPTFKPAISKPEEVYNLKEPDLLQD